MNGPTTNLTEIHAGRVLDAEPTYGRPVRLSDVDDVENAYRLYVDRLTELLANLAAEGLLPARFGVGMLPNPYQATDDLGEIRDVIENGGMQ